MRFEGKLGKKKEYAVLEFNLFNKHFNVSTHQVLLITKF